MAITELITIAENEPLQPIRAGTWKRVIASMPSLGVAEIFFDAGVETDDHGHAIDQVAYQVRGRFEVTLDGATRVLGPGDGYAIPAETPHRVRCLEQGSYILVSLRGPEPIHSHHEHDHDRAR